MSHSNNVQPFLDTDTVDVLPGVELKSREDNTIKGNGWFVERVRYNQDCWEIMLCLTWFNAKYFQLQKRKTFKDSYEITRQSKFYPGQQVACIKAHSECPEHRVGNILTVHAWNPSIKTLSFANDPRVQYMDSRFAPYMPASAPTPYDIERDGYLRAPKGIATTHVYKDSYEITRQVKLIEEQKKLADKQPAPQPVQANCPCGEWHGNNEPCPPKTKTFKRVYPRVHPDGSILLNAINKMARKSDGRPQEYEGDVGIASNRKGKSNE